MTAAAVLRPLLHECGFRGDLLRSDYPVINRGTGARTEVAALAAFANPSPDLRSACIVVLNRDPSVPSKERVESVRSVGAPIVFIEESDSTIEMWRQNTTKPKRLRSFSPDELTSFFSEHSAKLSPDAILRAKIYGRYNKSYQISFVDIGLLPMIEAEAGQHLSRLLEEIVQDLLASYETVTDQQRHNVLLESFWLIAAKILQDKNVPGFENMDFGNVSNVFRRVWRHYGYESGQPGQVVPLSLSYSNPSSAMISAAARVERFANLGQVTTESLAYVYENSLVSDETRNLLGIHSTPPYLVDYIISRVEPLVGSMPENERHVFEPACGHAAFLVPALRMLRGLASGKNTRELRYVRQRLHGLDIDPLAIELARLSLTLADIPNPNGWDLHKADVFTEDGDQILQRLASQCNVLLANPPFERFSPEQRQRYAQSRSGHAFQNGKSSELLARVLPVLRPGAVLGLVLPATFLTSGPDAHIRRQLVSNFDLVDVCHLPDNVFRHSSSEIALVVACKTTTARNRFSFTRVREKTLGAFERSPWRFRPSNILQSGISKSDHCSLRVPELYELWQHDFSHHLSDVATVGQGLSHYSSKRLEKTGTWGVIDVAPVSSGVGLFGLGQPRKRPRSGAVKGFATFTSDSPIHGLPAFSWINLAKESIDRPRSGVDRSVPQVLVNYSPVRRGFWRMMAYLDDIGHPVLSVFLVVRPADGAISLPFLWAVLNSVIANAYVYSHCSKRHILKGVLDKLPIPEPSLENIAVIGSAASRYMKAASDGRTPDTLLRDLFLDVERKVLAAYCLENEQLADVIRLGNATSEERNGLPFGFSGYPEGFVESVESLKRASHDESGSKSDQDTYQKLVLKKHTGGLSPSEESQMEAIAARMNAREMRQPLNVLAIEENERRMQMLRRMMRSIDSGGGND